MKHLFLTALFAPLLATTLSANETGVHAVHDSFDAGQNLGGWIYNAGDAIEPVGGNPGGWLHQEAADTFYPIWISQTDVYTGDFRAAGVTELEFDAGTLSVDFGTGAGFNMSIILRDTKGTGTTSDDDSAWLVGAASPEVGQGWQSYSFAIPSADVSALPAGWSGSFQAGNDWNDLIQSVDQVEISWSDPELFAIFQRWNIGLDNITLHAAGRSTVRNGSGSNPVGFAEVTPCEIGTTWTTTIDLVTPGAVLSLLTLGIGGPTSGGFFPPSGEVLVLPPYKFFIRTGTTNLSVPNDPSLLGACIYTQGSAVLADGTILFNNALDVLIGG